MSVDTMKPIQGHDEYYNLFSLGDTCFKNTNPLLVEVTIGPIQSAMPYQAWLV